MCGSLAGAALSGSWRLGGAAQSLSGEISVHFEKRGGLLEQEIYNAIASLTEANLGLSIKVAEPVAGDYLTELTLSLFAGDAPDVFVANSVATAQLAAAGAVRPLDQLLQTWPDWTNYPPEITRYFQFDGQFWGVPYSLDTHFFYYRKDRFTEAGLPVPWQPTTLDEVTNAARAIKSALPDVIPLVLFAGANPGNSTAVRGFLPLLRAFGGDLTDSEGRWIIDSCPIRNALGYYELVYRTEELTPQSVMTAVGASDAMRGAFGAGEAAMLFDGSWMWDDWSRTVEDVDDRIGYTLFPAADGSAPFTIGGVGPTWFMSTSTEQPELAWALIAAMNARDVVTRLNLDDPHLPPRADSAADAAFQNTPFLAAMEASFDVAELSPPDPAFRDMVGIIQNATGLIATGEVSAADAVERYSDELARVLGDENVVRLACP